MFRTFKSGSSPEFSALSKKHGMANAVFIKHVSIKHVSYSSNVALEDIDETRLKDIETGVRYVVQALMDNAGLTKSECRLLQGWSCQLAGDKVPFLTARAHTIIDARGKGPFSKYDLSFIHYVASCIKFEAASTNKTLADFAKEHGDILDLAYTVAKGRYKALKSNMLENLNGAMAEFTIASSHPETLVNIEAAIDELEDVSKAFTSIQTQLEEQIQLLHQASEALKK
ncbi:Ff.00g005390.m01.CDS01 [Fusarium sp. VM40]|nr:Ff.00g005390.m01.CDS01 [Fusarium sp. VM40]